MCLTCGCQLREHRVGTCRYNVMYNVGVKDLYEGLQSSAKLYIDSSIAK